MREASTTGSTAAESSAIEAPVAKQQPERVTVHGRTLVDPYKWLRNRGTTEVTHHLAAENAYAESVLARDAKFVADLVDAALQSVPARARSAERRRGRWVFWHEWARDAAHPVYWRRRTDGTGTPEVVLDPAALGSGRGGVRIDLFELSPDGESLAYTVDDVGFGEYRLVIRDITSGREIGPAAVERVASVAWAADGRTYYYVVRDPVTRRPYQAYRRRLGGSQAQLLHDEVDMRMSVSVETSRSGELVFLVVQGYASSEVWFASATDSAAAFTVVAPRRRGHHYAVEHRGDALYILTNDDAPQGRVVQAPVLRPSKPNWRELVPANDDAAVVGLEAFEDYLIVHERRRGSAAIRVHTFADGETHRVELPLRHGEVEADAGGAFDAAAYRFDQHFGGQRQAYRYDVAARHVERVESAEPGVDASNVTTMRIFAATSDATTIPITLSMSRDRPREPGPLVLDVHAADAVVHAVDDSPIADALIERGVAFAVAHVRGGGELGPGWHEAGSGSQLGNRVTDLAAAVSFLVREGYTTPKQLVLRGTGAGATTVAALLNADRKAAGAAILRAPFLDVLGSLLDDTLPGTTLRHGQWGDPRSPASFATMAAFCPYQNLAAGPYPPMIVRSAVSDTDSMYWDAAKYVARLREVSDTSAPTLLVTDLRWGATSRLGGWHDDAVEYVFALRQVGWSGEVPSR